MNDEARTIAWYQSRLSAVENVTSAAKVGFDDPLRQELRWQILLESISISPETSILDAGCGLAGMLQYLETSIKITPFYHGTDLVDEYLTRNRSKYDGHPNISFSRLNVMKEAIPGSFDLITASGLFTLNLDNAWDSLEYFLKSGFNALNEGGCVAVNLFTSYVNYRDAEFSYFEPERIYTLARSISRSLVIRSDYLPYDFTLYLYRRND